MLYIDEKKKYSSTCDMVDCSAINRSVYFKRKKKQKVGFVKTYGKVTVHDLLQKKVKPGSYLNDTAIMSKIIRTNGTSRGYFSYITRNLYNVESFFFKRRWFGKFKLNKSVGKKLIHIPLRLRRIMEHNGITNMLELFQFYIGVTQPILAFYLIKKRSFKKKKKINKIVYNLRLASKFRRRNKLMHQVKSVFFKGPNRRSVGHLKYSTLSFFKNEFFNTSESTFMKKKQKLYEVTGGEVMNNIIHNERVRR